MFGSQIAEVNTAREAARSAAAQMQNVAQFVADYRDPQGRRFDDAGLIDGQIYSLREAVKQADIALAMFLALNADKNKPLPTGQWQPALAAVQDLNAASGELSSQMATVRADIRILSVANGSTITVKDTGEPVANFTAGAIKAASAADNLIIRSTILMALSKTSLLAKNNQEGITIANDAKAVAHALTAAEASARQATDAATKAQSMLAATEEARAADQARFAGVIANLESTATGAQTLVEQIRTASTTASEQVAVAVARVADASSVKSQTEAVAKAIADYNATLDATKKRVDAAESSALQAVKEVKDQTETVGKLIEDAESMLKGATVAGLATTFANERAALDKSMTGAIIWFGVGIVLLTMMTFPLAAYVLNIPLHILGVDVTHFNGDAKKFEPTVAGVISRAIILLGPFWLSLFSARRYARLFDLRQRYSHKYNMAMSIEGFKKQAPSYAEAISAWVFQIVAENPVQQKSGAPMEDAPSISFKDIGSSLMEQVGKAFGG